MIPSPRTLRNIRDLLAGEQRIVSLNRFEARGLLYRAYAPDRRVTVCLDMADRAFRLDELYRLADEAVSLQLDPHQLHHDLLISMSWGDTIAVKIPNRSRA